jgi:hypothetical protein
MTATAVGLISVAGSEPPDQGTVSVCPGSVRRAVYLIWPDTPSGCLAGRTGSDRHHRVGAESIDAQRLAAELAEQARAEGVELVGPGGLLTRLTKTVLETAGEAEMSERPGYDNTIRPAVTAATPATKAGAFGRWGTAGTERHLRIRARGAAGPVAGAANYQTRTRCPQSKNGLPT